MVHILGAMVPVVVQEVRNIYTKLGHEILFTNWDRLWGRWKCRTCVHDGGLKPEDWTSIIAGTTCTRYSWTIWLGISERFPYLCVAIQYVTLLTFGLLFLCSAYLVLIITVRSGCDCVIFNACLHCQWLVCSLLHLRHSSFLFRYIPWHWETSRHFYRGIRCGI